MQKYCCECSFWVGRCLLGKKNKIAADPACEDFRKCSTIGELAEAMNKTPAENGICAYCAAIIPAKDVVGDPTFCSLECANKFYQKAEAQQ